MRGCYIVRCGRGESKDCRYPFDAAHFIPKRRIREALKRRGVPAAEIAPAVWDTRVYTTICRYHHGELDNKRIRLTEADYPVRLQEWADEYGFYFDPDRADWFGEYQPPRGEAA